MDETTARRLLASYIDGTGRLTWTNQLAYLHWHPTYTHIELDGSFSADMLEALAWWMLTYGQAKDTDGPRAKG